MLAGTLVSLLGDGIYVVAIAFAVLAISHGPAALSLVGLTWSVGILAFVLVGGVLADRRDKRHLLLAADALRLVALAGAGILSVAGLVAVWHLLLLSLVYGIGEGLSGPAMSAIVPELVPDSVLVEANALAGTLRPLALRMLGPALGGGIVALAGTGGALLVDAATFAVSIACLLAMRSRGAVVPAGAESEPLRRQVREAASFVREQRWLWATLALGALALLLFLGPTEVLLPYRVKHDLDATAGAFGLVLAAIGTGTVLGSVAIGQRGAPRREITFLYWAWGLATFTLCGYAVAESIWQLVVFGLLFGLLNGAGNPVWATLMQVRVPEQLRGRVASLDWLISIGLTPVSFALTAPLATLVGARATLMGAGLLGGVAFLAVLYGLPRLREEDGALARLRARGAVSPRRAP